jgi:hypothetical protein
MGPNKIQTRTLASYNSILLDQPTQHELYNPLWTFARAKASDSDTGTHNPPSTATSMPAAACVAAAAGPDSKAAAGGQQGAVLSKLISMQRVEEAAASSCFAQQHVLQGAEDSAYAAATVAAQAVTSPFASPSGDHELLTQRETLQMVSLADLIIPVPPEAAGLQEEQHSPVSSLPKQGSAAAAMQVAAERSVTASPSDSSSAAGSRLLSRQSSGRALLAGKHIDSSAAAAAAAPVAEAHKHGSKPFDLLHRRSTGHKPHKDANLQPAAASGELLDSADDAVTQAAGGRVRRRFSNCAPSGCGWSRLDARSTEDDAPVVTFAADEQGQHEQQQERKQRRAAARMAEKAAARLAAKQLGVDVDWWQYKTGDLLLDRHIVRPDIEKELGSTGEGG